MKRILVLTSGGDAPGMNAAIRAVVRTGHFYGIEMFGTAYGFQGLVDRSIFPLIPANVANCIQHGGTILKTGRCLAFHEFSERLKCRDFLKEQNIDGLIIIGGDGSFKGASLLSSEGGPKVVGIPATIDNDIVGTTYTLGYDTARNTALEAIDKIRDTAFSHDRHFLVEVMGRHSGFLALDVGIAGGAEFILTPEFPLSVEELAAKITAPRRTKANSIIVIAEDDHPGRSMGIADALRAITGLQYRVCILGHTQRGGSPTTLDRKMGSQMGFLAVKSLMEGANHRMVALQAERLTLCEFPDPDAGARILTDRDLLDINSILCS